MILCMPGAWCSLRICYDIVYAKLHNIVHGVASHLADLLDKRHGCCSWVWCYDAVCVLYMAWALNWSSHRLMIWLAYYLKREMIWHNVCLVYGMGSQLIVSQTDLLSGWLTISWEMMWHNVCLVHGLDYRLIISQICLTWDLEAASRSDDVCILYNAWIFISRMRLTTDLAAAQRCDAVIWYCRCLAHCVGSHPVSQIRGKCWKFFSTRTKAAVAKCGSSGHIRVASDTFGWSGQSLMT